MKSDKVVNWNGYWSKKEMRFSKVALEILLKVTGFSRLTCHTALKIAKRLLQEQKKLRIVEVGCGEGTLAYGLKRSYPECEVILIDISFDVLLKIEGSWCHRINASILTMPLKSGSCDLCCNVGTIEHFKQPALIIEEMKRISRNIVLCAVPAPSIIWRFATMIRRIVEKDASLWTDGTSYFSEADLLDLFERTGLRNVGTAQQRFLGLPFMNIVYGRKDSPAVPVTQTKH